MPEPDAYVLKIKPIGDKEEIERISLNQISSLSRYRKATLPRAGLMSIRSKIIQNVYGDGKEIDGDGYISEYILVTDNGQTIVVPDPKGVGESRIGTLQKKVKHYGDLLEKGEYGQLVEKKPFDKIGDAHKYINDKTDTNLERIKVKQD